VTVELTDREVALLVDAIENRLTYQGLRTAEAFAEIHRKLTGPSQPTEAPVA
jgi:hypothetical protein